MKDISCHDCVVTFFLNETNFTSLDENEIKALDVLANSGLVPPLRHVCG